MKKNEKPVANEKEFTLRAELWKRFNQTDFNSTEHLYLLNQLTQLENKYEWYPTIFYVGNLCGIKSVTGDILIPAEYDNVDFFPFLIENQSTVAVCKNNKWGLVTTKGNNSVVSDFLYDSIAPITGKLVAVKLKEKYGYLDVITGKPASDFNFDMIYLFEGRYTFMNGYSEFSKDDLYGLTNGILFTEPIFDEIIWTPDQYFNVKYNGEVGYINQMGQFTKDVNEADWGI